MTKRLGSMSTDICCTPDQYPNRTLAPDGAPWIRPPCDRTRLGVTRLDSPARSALTCDVWPYRMCVIGRESTPPGGRRPSRDVNTVSGPTWLVPPGGSPRRSLRDPARRRRAGGRTGPAAGRRRHLVDRRSPPQQPGRDVDPVHLLHPHGPSSARRTDNPHDFRGGLGARRPMDPPPQRPWNQDIRPGRRGPDSERAGGPGLTPAPAPAPAYVPAWRARRSRLCCFPGSMCEWSASATPRTSWWWRRCPPLARAGARTAGNRRGARTARINALE